MKRRVQRVGAGPKVFHNQTATTSSFPAFHVKQVIAAPLR